MKFFLAALEKALKEMLGEGFKSQSRLIGKMMAEELIKEYPELSSVKKEDFQAILEKIMDTFKKERLVATYERQGEDKAKIKCIVHEIDPEKAGEHIFCYISRGFMDEILKKSGVQLELKVEPHKDHCIYSLGKIEI